MAEPLFSEKELADFDKKLKEIDSDKISFKDYKEQWAARDAVHNAYYAQAVVRIRKQRMEDFLNFLLIIVGGKGTYTNVRVWNAFSEADNFEYLDALKEENTPLNMRYVHMFLKAVLVAHRNWAVTAFVKFLRGNKVAGGRADKLEGFGDFHKDSGWNEIQVKSVAMVLFDERSEVSKLFMEYDSDLTDRVYKASQEEENWDIPYEARFSATSKAVNVDFLKELIALVETKPMAEKPTSTKKAFKPHVAKIFKEGDVIQKNTIADLLPLSIVEIKVTLRNKQGDQNTQGTIQIVIVETPKPRFYLSIWRIVDGKAYYPGGIRDFDRDRKCLEGAVYKGQWEAGVQAHKSKYEYPYNYIGIPY